MILNKLGLPGIQPDRPVTMQELRSLRIFEAATLEAISKFRGVRNEVLHGEISTKDTDIKSITFELRDLIARLKSYFKI